MLTMLYSDLDDDDRARVDRVAQLLRQFVRDQGVDGANGGDDGGTTRDTTDAVARLEWSQAGTEHSGRFVLDPLGASRRVPTPSEVTEVMAQLRAQMAKPGTGTWLSAVITVSPDNTEAEFNYSQRPYWNAPGESMLEAPAAPPVPDERRWAADLRRYPRDQDNLLVWMAAPVIADGEVARLRQALTQAGFPPGGVHLPGDDTDAFEGALAVVRHSSSHYSLQITDYGQHEFLAEYPYESYACRAVWDYLHQPLPAPTQITSAELTQRANAAAPAYRDLHERLVKAGPGGLVTNLATGVPFDRVGTLDGLYFFAFDTPWETRSLPQSASGPGAQQLVLMASRPIEVQAQIVEPWFDQPGGGLRFRVENAPRQGLRDLVRAGVLVQVQVVG